MVILSARLLIPELVKAAWPTALASPEAFSSPWRWPRLEKGQPLPPTLPIHSLRLPRLPCQFLLAPLQPHENPVRLVEEFPQGVDVNVLVPADHEDAGGARCSIPGTCNKARQRPGSSARAVLTPESGWAWGAGRAWGAGWP